MAISSTRARALLHSRRSILLWRLSSSWLRGGLGMAGEDSSESSYFCGAGANGIGRRLETIHSDASGKNAHHNPPF